MNKWLKIFLHWLLFRFWQHRHEIRILERHVHSPDVVGIVRLSTSFTCTCKARLFRETCAFNYQKLTPRNEWRTEVDRQFRSRSNKKIHKWQLVLTFNLLKTGNILEVSPSKSHIFRGFHNMCKFTTTLSLPLYVECKH